MRDTPKSFPQPTAGVRQLLFGFQRPNGYLSPARFVGTMGFAVLSGLFWSVFAGTIVVGVVTVALSALRYWLLPTAHEMLSDRAYITFLTGGMWAAIVLRV